MCLVHILSSALRFFKIVVRIPPGYVIRKEGDYDDGLGVKWKDVFVVYFKVFQQLYGWACAVIFT
jgi:hypothetical protein